MRKTILAVLACAYTLALLDVTLLRFPQPGPPPNWVPLATIGHYCQIGGWDAVRNLVGNLVLFIPLGFILPELDHAFQSALRTGMFAFSASLAIEALQYASGQRVADIDDVLLNTMGGCLGYTTFVISRVIKIPCNRCPDSCTNRSIC